MPEGEGSDYYLKRTQKYWRQLGRLFRSSDRFLPRYLDAGLAGEVRGQSYQEFQRVLAGLPYIGGDDNILTFTLVSSAAALAYIRVLERHGLPPDTIGTLLNAVYHDVFTSLPGIVRWWLQRSEFSSRHQKALRAYAERSQRREYPGDWVMEYLEGDGGTFDFGCDYIDCAVLKLYRQMGAEAYMPYVCVMDFAMSRALRTGLRRTTTLYYGGSRCDFRYQKDRLGLAALPIEDLPEYRNRSA